MAKKKTNPNNVSLKSVTPSGKRDQNFFENVYALVRQIPKGRVSTYGAIASALGTKLSARMVGWAMNGAHQIVPAVPAHRVVNRNGQLTGRLHFAYPEQMQELLEAEGIIVLENTIKDFEKVFWNPQQDLNI